MQRQVISTPRYLLRNIFQQQQQRTISNNPRIVQSQVLRKIKKGIDRLPSQGKDPALAFKNGWRLASATILERYPTIIPEQHPFEHEYLQNRFLAHQLQSIPMPSEAFLTERDVLEGRKEPNFKDALAEEYQPGPRITKADHDHDTKSLDRALDERLYFLVKASHNSKVYRFPQILANDDDIKLWDYAKKAFNAVTVLDDRPDVHFIGNRPCCHLEHVFPVKYQQEFDVYGVKIFFYRAVLLNGQINQVKNSVDYIWARETELKDLVGGNYYNSIEPALYGVGPKNNYQV